MFYGNIMLFYYSYSLRTEMVMSSSVLPLSRSVLNTLLLCVFPHMLVSNNLTQARVIRVEGTSVEEMSL